MILIWCYYLVSNYLTSIQTMYTRIATSSHTIYTNAKQSLQNQKTKIIFKTEFFFHQPDGFLLQISSKKTIDTTNHNYCLLKLNMLQWVFTKICRN